MIDETTILYFFAIPSIILFNIAQIPFYKNIRFSGRNIYILKNNRRLSFIKITALIFCVFGAYSGDWIHYLFEINILGALPKIPEQRHFEPIYLWLIENVTHTNYILFRFIIWSLALLSLNFGLKRLHMDNIISWDCYLIICMVVSYAIGRGALGFSLIVWGYSYLLNPGRRKLVGFIKGIVLLTLSIFCHKSMFLLAPLTLLSFVKLNFKRIILICLLTFLMIGLFRDYVMRQLMADSSTAGREYFEEGEGYTGIGMNLWIFSYYIIIYSIIAYSFFRIVIKRDKIPLFIKRIFNFTILIFFEYIAIYFAFTFVGLGNWDLGWRIFTMLNIPIPLLLSYFLSKRFPKPMLYLYNFTFLMADYFILYNVYTNY